MKTYLEPDEVRAIEQATTCVRDQILVRLLFRLGCRISEALGLRIKDIDFEKGTITIEHLKTRLKLSCPQCNARLGRSHVFCPKCGIRVEKTVAEAKEHRRVRTLPIDAETLEIVKEYVDRGGPVEDDHRYLFGINRHHAYRQVRIAAWKAGLYELVNPDTGKGHAVSPHRFRDAFAIHAMKQNDSGDGLRILQQHLGHQSISTTMKYRKISGEEQEEWYRRLWGEEP